MKKLYLLLALLLMLAQSSFSQVTVGEQTSTVPILPVYPYYGYTYSQSIYPASSIGASGDITGITYRATSSINLSVSDNWGVYIGHTSQSNFSTTSSWVDITTLDTVNYGTVYVVGDSVHIQFDTPFSYNGVDNIVIAVEENAPGYGSYGYHFFGSQSDSISIYHINDSNNQDPSSPPNGTISSNFPTVTFQGIVQACVAPQNLTADSLTYYSVFAEWEGDSTSTYLVELESANSTSIDTLTNTTQIYIDTLDASTDYTINVQKVCGSGDSSIFVSVNFTTLCGYETPDYLEAFDSFIPNCWEERKGVISDSTVFSTTTLVGWNGTTSFANASGQSSATKINMYSNVYDWLFSPSIDLGDGSSSYMLEFDIALTSYYSTTANSFGIDDQFAVVISLDNGLTWSSDNILESWSSGMTFSNTGEVLVYDLSAYTGLVKIGFYAYSPTANNDIDLHIDNFSVKEIPPCPDPTALDALLITDSSAVLTWVGNPNDSIYFVVVGEDGFDIDSATVQQFSSDSVMVDSLLPNTSYEFYVSVLCSGSDSSGWRGPYSFQTLCEVISVPSEVEMFNTYLPECWKEANGLLSDTNQFANASSSVWTADGFGNVGTTGSARVNIYGGNVEDWLITNTFDLGTPLTNYQAEFRLGLTSFYNSNPAFFGIDDRFIFMISTDGGATWLSTNILQEWNSSHALGVDEHIVIDLGAYTGQVAFAFYAESQVYNNDINVYVDDFVINKCTEYINISDTVCDSYVSPLGNEYTTTGVHTDTIVSQACDTVYVIDLQVNSFSVDSVQIVECDTFVSVSGNLLTESGIYFDTIPNVLGCDSIVQTVLSVLYIDLTLDLDNNIFVSSNETDPAAEYTWINCSDGSVIEGENSPNFVATELGEYACIISMLNCTKTTDCIEVTSLDTTSSDSTISIDELNSFTSVKVYPNPSRGEFKIEMEDYFDGATLNIFNAVGQVVHSQKIKDSVTTVDLNATERGLYFISIKSENKIYRSRIIID